MNKDVYIVDTTLRDGEQCPGKIFSKDEKLNIAKYLENTGVYQIEAGIPAMGNYDKEIIKNIIANRKSILVSTWNRINIKDIISSIECNPDIIHLSVPTSDIQIFSKLNKDKQWVEKTTVECVGFAKDNGFQVTVGFEDASRTNVDYLIKLCEILKNLGVNRVRYADTLGILTPDKLNDSIIKIIKNTGMDVEIHAHNDFGMAIANSIEAVKIGAKYVNCTLGGIGERAGNCDLEEFMRASEKFFTIKY